MDFVSWVELQNMLPEGESMSSFIENCVRTRVAIIKDRIDEVELEKKIKLTEGELQKKQEKLTSYREMLETMKREKEKEIKKEEKERVRRAKRTVAGLRAAGIH